MPEKEIWRALSQITQGSKRKYFRLEGAA